MSKEYQKIVDLIIEFDEMGYQTATLCPDMEEEINSFRRRLHNISLVLQEQEKVLSIIKEKTVNILLLELAENVDEYNERIVPNGKLTQEEFNLLKEML